MAGFRSPSARETTTTYLTFSAQSSTLAMVSIHMVSIPTALSVSGAGS